MGEVLGLPSTGKTARMSVRSIPELPPRRHEGRSHRDRRDRGFGIAAPQRAGRSPGMSVRWRFVLSLTMSGAFGWFCRARPSLDSAARVVSRHRVRRTPRRRSGLAARAVAVDRRPPAAHRPHRARPRGAAIGRVPATLADLDRRLNAYADRRVSVVLSLGAFPDGDDQVEAWRQSIRTVAEHGSGKVAAYQIGPSRRPRPRQPSTAMCSC